MRLPTATVPVPLEFFDTQIFYDALKISIKVASPDWGEAKRGKICNALPILPSFICRNLFFFIKYM